MVMPSKETMRSLIFSCSVQSFAGLLCFNVRTIMNGACSCCTVIGIVINVPVSMPLLNR